jgi:hypothetical protein
VYPQGIFGPSTGATVHLFATAKSGVEISSITSRGGDLQEALTHSGLEKTKAADLFLRGEQDTVRKGEDEQVKGVLIYAVDKDINYIPNAAHQFEVEALEKVAWFSKYLKQDYNNKTPLLKDLPTDYDMLGR